VSQQEQQRIVVGTRKRAVISGRQLASAAGRSVPRLPPLCYMAAVTAAAVCVGKVVVYSYH